MELLTENSVYAFQRPSVHQAVPQPLPFVHCLWWRAGSPEVGGLSRCLSKAVNLETLSLSRQEEIRLGHRRNCCFAYFQTGLRFYSEGACASFNPKNYSKKIISQAKTPRRGRDMEVKDALSRVLYSFLVCRHFLFYKSYLKVSRWHPITSYLERTRFQWSLALFYSCLVERELLCVSVAEACIFKQEAIGSPPHQRHLGAPNGDRDLRVHLRALPTHGTPD